MLQHDTILITHALPLNLVACTEGGTQTEGVLETVVLRTIFQPKRYDVTEVEKTAQMGR